MKYLFIVIISLGAIPVRGQTTFLTKCNKSLLNSTESQNYIVQNQISWLQTIFKSKDCKTISEKIKKLKSFSEILPSRVFKDFSLPTNLFLPLELKGTQISIHLFEKEWEIANEYFRELDIFKEFGNLTHINFSNKSVEGRDICQTLKQVPSIQSITLKEWNLKDNEIDCVLQNKTKIYLIGSFTPDSTFNRLKDSIYGIQNFIGDIEELNQYKKLSYLGLMDYKGKSSLKVLMKIRNLTSLHINVQNIQAPEDIAHLKHLKHLSLNCFKTSFSEVPKSVNERRCAGNALKDVRFLKGLTWLQGLDLSWNDLEDISPISHLEYLQVLNLKFNRLKSIPKLKAIGNLRYLNVSSNEIQTLNLQEARSLRFLNLSHNNVSEIEDLSTLSELEYLSLANNSISSVESYPKNLKFLNLDGNKTYNFNPIKNYTLPWLLRSLPENSEEKYWPEQILFEDMINYFQIVPPKLKPGEKLDFDVSKLKNLQVLSMRGTNLEKVSNLTSLKNLKFLDFSNSNQKFVLNLPMDIEYLKLRNNHLENFSMINGLKKLKVLDLGENNLKGIKLIINSNDLLILKLDNCKLLEEPDLSSATNLYTLELQENGLQKFNPSKLSSLHSLNLSRNLIDEIPDFSHNTEIKNIYLDNNKISSLDKIETLTNSLEKFPHISLQNNQIEDLSIFMIKTLENIGISIDGNPIKKTSTAFCPDDSYNSTINSFCKKM